MKKVFSTLLALSGVTAVMWFSACPDGLRIVTSSTPFAVADSMNDVQVAHAALAKQELTKVVLDFPQ